MPPGSSFPGGPQPAPRPGKGSRPRSNPPGRGLGSDPPPACKGLRSRGSAFTQHLPTDRKLTSQLSIPSPAPPHTHTHVCKCMYTHAHTHTQLLACIHVHMQTYMDIRAHICTFMNAHTCTRMPTQVSTCTHMDAWTCMHIRAHLCAHTDVHMHICMYAHACTCIHAHTCTYMHIQAHTYMRVHASPCMHTLRWACSQCESRYELGEHPSGFWAAVAGAAACTPPPLSHPLFGLSLPFPRRNQDPPPTSSQRIPGPGRLAIACPTPGR